MIQKGAWYGVWWVWVFWICGKPPIVNVKIWQFEAQTPAIFPFWGIALLHSDTRGLSCFLGGSKNKKDTKPISRHSTRARAVYAIILHCFNKLVWSKNHWKAMPNILSIIIHWNMSCVCVCWRCVCFSGTIFWWISAKPQSAESAESCAQGQGTCSIPRHRWTPTNGVRVRPIVSVTGRHTARL